MNDFTDDPVAPAASEIFIQVCLTAGLCKNLCELVPSASNFDDLNLFQYFFPTSHSSLNHPISFT